MTTTPKITEAQIRALTDAESFRRGQEYFRRGAVDSLARRGTELLAEVEGSQYEPYQITITFDAGGIKSYECSCPVGGACKHVVAALLAYSHDPEAAVERPTVESLLAELGQDDLRAIIIGLAGHNSDLIDQIEAQVLALRVSKDAPKADGQGKARERRTPVDVAPYRRQMRAALRSPRGYESLGSVGGSVLAVANEAQSFIDAGDGRNALAILQAVTEEFIAGWEVFDDSDGEATDYYGELGDLLAEAFLAADLSDAERKSWVKQVQQWQNYLDDYGLDGVFSVAEQAAETGWDDPELQGILSGAITSRVRSVDDDEVADTDLTDLMLNVLEREGRTEEYLNLARVDGKTTEYLTMLAKLGRTAEAVESGLRDMTTVGQAAALAKALREKGAIDEALRVGEYGLQLGGDPTLLARWLRDVASGAGRGDLALAAALVVVRHAGNLDDYRAVEPLAGDGWTKLRETLLDELRHRSSNPDTQTEIFLHEKLIDDAIKAVSRAYSRDLLAKVVEAAAATRPDWAIATANKQAAEIMDAAKAKYYQNAAEWLRRAGLAYKAAGREAEWRSYIGGLLARHARKRNLVPLLENLLRR